VPTRASRLPNAPRDYRSGIHRGIDFFSNWGTEVKSVADGIVIRSDLFYKEIPAGFRVDILKQAARLKRTPSDIFNELLLGQAIIIDHGFNLFPGYRSITIYAHLSYIEKKISPGSKVEAGQILGRSGNTGTRPSTLGTKEESHLHWELILQDAKGEYYFGQDMDYESLLPALNQIFKN
jgi:murein DD-endopeptidase MepM/ murein hydrolase activator NlpD